MRRLHDRVDHLFRRETTRIVARVIGNPRVVPRAGRVSRGKLISIRGDHQLQNPAQVESAARKCITELVEQSRMRGLHILFHEIE